jgi:hypothetical protein
MNVENGGRIELKLGDAGEGSATYAARLQVADASWDGAARVGEGEGPGKVSFGAWRAEHSEQVEPPAWLLDDARAALKAALRTSQAEGRWPRRITRWRPEPSG